MRLLLGKMFSPAIARALRERGHDVEAIKEHPARQALSDAEGVSLARAERRAIVTANVRDFRPLHADLVIPGAAGHAGMVFVPRTYRLTRDDLGRFVAALEFQLQAHPGGTEIANSEIWL